MALPCAGGVNRARMSLVSFALSSLWAVLLFPCVSAASTPPEKDHPQPPVIKLPAPDLYRARVITSKGPFVIEVHREWAPLAADRFYELVCSQFYSQARFYRVVKGFVVQFGMPADPAIYEQWREKTLEDEPVRTSNKRGTVSFTGSAARNSRTTHVFINLADNDFLDNGSAPFGLVSSGMDVVDSLFDGYGENAPMGKGPEQNRLWKEGNRYLLADFPDLDFIIDIEIDH